jgi:hypothetical protein
MTVYVCLIRVLEMQECERMPNPIGQPDVRVLASLSKLVSDKGNQFVGHSRNRGCHLLHVLELLELPKELSLNERL